ncbi:MAG: glycosyltransferase WbuB [Desulfobacteraceae bacterium]|nr:MAG: glycosyltransferase WbuB [Desulfobacteraceae bacterium]
MNIVLINHYAGSREHGMEYRPYYLASEWVKKGHDVTIIASSFSHVRTFSPEMNGPLRTDDIDGIKYVWLKTPSYPGNGVKRAINIFSFTWSLYRYLSKLTENKIDAFIASSTHPLDMIPAGIIAGKMNAKVIYEVHDLWPLSLIELGGMSSKHPFILLLQWAENHAYRKADIVVSMLPKAKDHMLQHGMDKSKFHYIPNGINVSEWNSSRSSLPETHSRILNTIKENGSFMVMYAGAHGIANALPSLIQAANIVKNDPIAFVLVGQGPEKEHLRNLADQLGLRNVIFLPPVDKTSVPELLSRADALFIGLKKEPLFRFGISPNKLMDYLMAGKPVIQAIDAGNDIVTDSGSGMTTEPENHNQIADAILQLMRKSIPEREDMGLRGREYVLQHHDYRILSEQFLSILQGPVS